MNHRNITAAKQRLRNHNNSNNNNASSAANSWFGQSLNYTTQTMKVPQPTRKNPNIYESVPCFGVVRRDFLIIVISSLHHAIYIGRRCWGLMSHHETNGKCECDNETYCTAWSFILILVWIKFSAVGENEYVMGWWWKFQFRYFSNIIMIGSTKGSVVGTVRSNFRGPEATFNRRFKNSCNKNTNKIAIRSRPISRLLGVG